jgi:hypothetical protein
MLSAIMLSVIMLSVIMLSVIMLRVIMLSVTFSDCHAECHYAEYCSAVFHLHSIQQSGDRSSEVSAFFVVSGFRRCRRSVVATAPAVVRVEVWQQRSVIKVSLIVGTNAPDGQAEAISLTSFSSLVKYVGKTNNNSNKA